MTKQVVSGVLLLDKPIDISSHQALSAAKRLLMSDVFDSKKAGHTGTLDPMATGLLPLCFGEATKFSRFGLDANKSYTATIKLGSCTDTDDKYGQVLRYSPVLVFDQKQLDNVAKNLLGKQQQIPPMYSALKKDGKKLYEYARAGIEVEREARLIEIFELSLKKISDDEIELFVSCSKGTYVRVLAKTIADMLGMAGHLSALRRVATGGFSVMDAIGLDKLTNLPLKERFECLLPIDAMMTHLPKMMLSADEVKRILMGQRLNVQDRLPILTASVQMRLYCDDDFIGLGEIAPTGRLQPLRVVSGLS